MPNLETISRNRTGPGTGNREIWAKRFLKNHLLFSMIRKIDRQAPFSKNSEFFFHLNYVIVSGKWVQV